MKTTLLIGTVIFLNVFFFDALAGPHMIDSISEKSILSNIKEPEIPKTILYLKDFGGKGDGNWDNKNAFFKAINALKRKGGGHLIVNKGIYKINGPIHFISNLNLILEEGAVLSFGSNPVDYLPLVKTSWEGTYVYNYSPLIYAYQCKNVSITGKGIIDGEAEKTWSLWVDKQSDGRQLSRDMNHNRVQYNQRIFGDGKYLRPQLIQFYECENVKVEGIRIEDSPFWCLHLLRCKNVIVRGLSYDSQNLNNDGVDIESSKNVLVEDVYFNNYDDNIAIKAGRDDDGRASDMMSENIIIRNCYFMGKPAIAIGSEMSAGVQNVFISNCFSSGKLMRGIYLKSNADRGGFIRNIYIKNINFGEVLDCIYISSYYHNEGSGYVSDISNIHFENINCVKANGTGIVIQGFPDKKIKNVYFKNININWAKNGISMQNTENIVMSDVTIGEPATEPSVFK
jgi:polygalacturonase